MENSLNILIVQADLIWESTAGNISAFNAILAGTDADLIILPEMFLSGFTMNPSEVAETMEGEAVKWMVGKAAQLNSALCGSLVIEQDGQYYNRLLFVTPSGEIRHYDKRHLFTLAGEHRVYASGKERLIIDYKGWRICPLVCYDLRFPVFSRNDADYDLLIYVANWPKPRIAAWDTLLNARAVENMCYVAGVNRVGIDANGHRYPGHSQVVDCFGNVLAKREDEAGTLQIRLDRKSLQEARKKFPFLEDRDDFTVK